MKFMKKNLNVILFSSTELIQVYEAAKFAIQRVNAQNIVPGIRLGKPLFITFWKKKLIKKNQTSWIIIFSSLRRSSVICD